MKSNGPQGDIGQRLKGFQAQWKIELPAIATATGIPILKLREWESGSATEMDGDYTNLVNYFDEIDITGPSFKLSEKALKAINTPRTRRRLMEVFGRTEFTIARYIQSNNRKLTEKAEALKIIREECPLSDNEMLVLVR